MFSDKCSKTVTNLPNYGGIGRTLSLRDQELILLGNNEVGQYVSILKPREGLLGMKFLEKVYPLQNLPFQHSSLVSQNTLFVIGGKNRSNGRLSGSKWEAISFTWSEDGSIFDPDFEDACTLKVSLNEHIIFGGKNFGNKVVKIDTANLVAIRMKPMSRSRMSHGCQLMNENKVVLLSGGLWSNVVQQDELYNIESEEVIKVLNIQQSLARSNHVTIKMGDQIYALGGSTSRIETFDSSTHSWKNIDRNLLSSDTSEIVVSPFPLISLDCGCQCGMARKSKERIFDGQQAKVIQVFQSVHICIQCDF